jgi:hypothetical protein
MCNKSEQQINAETTLEPLDSDDPSPRQIDNKIIGIIEESLPMHVTCHTCERPVEVDRHHIAIGIAYRLKDSLGET